MSTNMNTDTKMTYVVNKINRDAGEHIGSLKEAQKKKDDEWYTPGDLISAELNMWADKFAGKDIICPCDWDIFSDEDGIEQLRIDFGDSEDNRSYTVKKVTYKKNTGLFDFDDGTETRQEETVTIDNEDDALKLLNGRVKCEFIRNLYQYATAYGIKIKSITASGYDPDTDRGIKFQDVDYSKYNLCITNPPFSLYGDFMAKMIEQVELRKGTDDEFDFVLLAPFLNRVTPNVGLNLWKKNCYLGYNIHVDIPFNRPKACEGFKKKVVSCDWITTWPDAQIERNAEYVPSHIDYNLYKDDYEIMENMTMKDGTHPIHVKFGTLPENYDGWMFGPVSILSIMSTDIFEWYLTSAKGFYNKQHPELNPFNHAANDNMVNTANKKGFHGIVFRKKKAEK